MCKRLRNIVRMLWRVHTYDYYLEKLICYYMSFLRADGVAYAKKVFLTLDDKHQLLCELDYIASVLTQLHEVSITESHTIYHSMMRFIAKYKKVVQHWWWMRKIVYKVMRIKTLLRALR